MDPYIYGIQAKLVRHRLATADSMRTVIIWFQPRGFTVRPDPSVDFLKPYTVEVSVTRIDLIKPYVYGHVSVISKSVPYTVRTVRSPMYSQFTRSKEQVVSIIVAAEVDVGLHRLSQ